MNSPLTTASIITLSARVYAALLRLYPATYRDAYAQPMVQVFKDVARG